MKLSLGLSLSGRVGGGGGPPPDPGTLARLTWPYDSGYVFEASAAGTRVGTLQDTTAGSTLSIVSVTDAAGAPVTGTPFALSGGDLVCGATPVAYVAGANRYAVTVRETQGEATRDTVMWAQVDPLAKQGSFSDNFNAPDGTRLVDRTGWNISTKNPGDATSLAALQVLGNALSVGNVGAALDVYCVPSSSSYSVRAKIAGTLNATTPSICAEFLGNTGGGYVKVSCSSSGRSISLQKKTGANVATTLINYDPGSVNPAHVGDEVGIDIDRSTNLVYLVFRGVRVANTAGYDISDITPAQRVGFGRDFGAASGGPQWDDFSVTSLPLFAIDPFPTPVFQKGAGGYGWIPLSGTYPGTAPVSLEYRIETVAGAVVTDWTAYSCQINNGTFRGYVSVASGGLTNYVVKVRDPANSGVVITSTNFRVGNIVLGYGQSNMFGLMNNNGSAVDTSGGFGLLSTGGNNSTPGNPTSPTNYNAAGFLNSFVTLVGEPVIFFNRAVSGQPLENLVPGTPAFAALELDLWRYRGRLSDVLVDQGEANAGSGTDPVTWAAGWNSLIRESILGRTNQRSAIVNAYMVYTSGRTDTGIETNASTQAGHFIIRRAQKKWAALDPNNMLSHHKFDMDYGAGETIHQSNADRLTKHGPRYAYSIAKKRGLAVNNRLGPLITGGSRSGAVITLTHDLNGASGLSDPGGTLGGWQVVAAPGWTGAQDPNSYFGTPATTPPLAISSVRVTGGAIVITLASDPGGPVALRYPATVHGTLFDGAQPFGQPYTDVGGQAAAPQIKGTYTDGDVGVAPLVDAIVIV